MELHFRSGWQRLETGPSPSSSAPIQIHPAFQEK
jgi:hypothetical protein